MITLPTQHEIIQDAYRATGGTADDPEGSLVPRVNEMRDDRDALLMALRTLQRDDTPCWCEMAIGNPMQRGHSVACTNARAAVDRPR